MAKKSIEVMVGLFCAAGHAGPGVPGAQGSQPGRRQGGGDTYTLKRALTTLAGSRRARRCARPVSPSAGRGTITLTPRPIGAWCSWRSEGLRVPQGHLAKILTAGLLGDQYIGLEAGADEKNLAAGDTIRQTQSAVVLESLIGQF